MNDLSVLLYFIMFAVVVGMTFAFMYSMMKSTLREFDKPRTHEKRSSRDGGCKIWRNITCLFY